MIPQNLNQIDRFEERFLRKAEEAANILGIFPTLGTGQYRAAFGACELIAGIVATCFCRLGQSFSKGTEHLKWKEFTRRADSYIVNGFGNIIRGGIETIPFGGLCLVIIKSTYKHRQTYIGEDKALDNQKYMSEETLRVRQEKQSLEVRVQKEDKKFTQKFQQMFEQNGLKDQIKELQENLKLQDGQILSLTSENQKLMGEIQQLKENLKQQNIQILSITSENQHLIQENSRLGPKTFVPEFLTPSAPPPDY